MDFQMGTEGTTTKVDSTITFSGSADELAGLWFHMDMKILLDGTLSSPSRQCAYAASLFRGAALQWLAKKRSMEPTLLSDYEAFKNTVEATWGLSSEARRIRSERELIKLKAQSGSIQTFTARFDVLSTELELGDATKALLYSSKLPLDLQDRVLVHDEETEYSNIRKNAMKYDLILKAIKGNSPTDHVQTSHKENKRRNKGKNKDQSNKDDKKGASTATATGGQLKVKAEVNSIAISRGADTGAVPPLSYLEPFNVMGTRTKALLDGGSAVNCIQPGLTWGLRVEESSVDLSGPTGQVLVANAGYVLVPVDGIPQRFYLVPGLQEQVILGRPYLEQVAELDVFCVDTTGVALPGRKARQLSAPEQKALDEYLDKALLKGWIRPSKASVAANILFVPKHHDPTDLRMCVDFRNLNEVTVKDKYPIPLLWGILRKVQNYRYFTVIDGKAAFHRLRTRPGDEHKLAFITPRGMFEYNVMPFGVTNGPSYQQRFMDKVMLPHADYSDTYIDDIIVYDDDYDEHVLHVQKIRQTLLENGIEEATEKTQYALETVNLLGMRISHGCIEARIDEQAIREWPTPSTKTELQRFLGMANWFRPFSQSLGQAAALLYSSTGKGTMLEWTPAHDESFQATKRSLIHTTRLHRFNQSDEVDIYTDASLEGTGAVLVQGGRIIAIVSKGFSPAEKNYTTTERELLGIVRAVRSWRHYLESTKEKIRVHTDHIALTQQLNKNGENRRINRWILALQAFQIDYVYCPGKDNPADAPSRMGFSGYVPKDEDVQSEDDTTMA